MGNMYIITKNLSKYYSKLYDVSIFIEMFLIVWVQRNATSNIC